ncbi:MAG: DEAD/DEAH box helicase family protein [Planctomycetes bacterium]|nr:DEAD/DEAH box helicase family protein [Planctomycetota bacterium]
MELLWDRGTIVCRGIGRDASPHLTCSALWDPRVEAWRAPARAYATWRIELSRSGRTLRDQVPPLLPAPAAFATPELRPYQLAALLAWHASECRGLVALPTGAGKTRVAIAAISRARCATLCLVPTRVLLDAWVGALRSAGAAEVGVFGDGEHSLRSITVATMASARARVEELGSRFELLIVDEAHHLASEEASELLEMYTAPRRLGLSATPPEHEAASARLERLLGPLVFRSSLHDLAGRYLAPFRVATLHLRLDAEERSRYEQTRALWHPLVQRFFELQPGASWADFVRAARASDEGRAALRAWQRTQELLRFPSAKRATVKDLLARHAAARALVFAPDARTACEIARQELIPLITADIGRAERARILEGFARGELGAIASAKVLNEGVDVPAAEIAVLVGTSGSRREYAQRVGRVLRPAEGKEALVYELLLRGTREDARFQRAREVLR